MKHTAVTCKMPVKDLLEKVAWVLYDEAFDEEEEGEEEKHALDGLQDILV